MRKKLLVFLLVFSFLLPTFVAPSFAVEETSVCGTDNVTYDSAVAAEEAGFDVSYESACTDVQSEEDLYEAEADIEFAGMLVEVGSTDVPTTIIIRRNIDSVDFTIEVNEDTVLGVSGDETKLSDWIPGDQIKVTGKQNENTDTIVAVSLVSLSIVKSENEGINGWITNIDVAAKTITYQWANQEHTFSYNDDTRFVSGLKNPATAEDLEINDRIRGRLIVGDESLAKIVIVLRRGENLFMKIRTFRPNVKLVRLDSAVIPTTIEVEIEKTEGLSADDVNNLIGTEGDKITININEDTKLVRKYFGRTTLDEFSIGDNLRIVGRVNDDGTVDAKVIKNNSIWKTSVNGYSGVVTDVNQGENYLMVNWTPVKYKTKKGVREVLDGAQQTVNAQMLGETKIPRLTAIKNKLMARVESVKEKIGNITREVRNRKVVINRISNRNVNIGDLIERGETKKIKIVISDDTKIIIGTNETASLADIKNGDKVRIRGIIMSETESVTAETVVVVGSIPEIEEDLGTAIDDVNEVVSVIVTDEEEYEDTDTEEFMDDEDAAEEESDETEDGDTANDEE